MPLAAHCFTQRPTDSKIVMSQQRITRRRFLGATAATAGGMLMSGIHVLDASPIVAPSDLASTGHFWYRPQPTGPYIDSQRDNKAFGFDDVTVFLSEDNARTWPHSIAFADAHNITFSSILKNGNIIFATGSRIYVSTDNLKTYHPITVKDAGGADYIPHEPQNSERPGWHFHPLDGVHTWEPLAKPSVMQQDSPVADLSESFTIHALI
jgi:hypothetical protein